MPAPAQQAGKGRLSSMTKLDLELVEDIAAFYDDPEGFVRYVFPWGQAGTPLADETGPDVWQCEVMGEIRSAIRSGADVQTAVQIAVSSGHGIGKTGFVAWIILWFMSTRDFPQVVVTANTKTQLTTKTWRELSKWHKLSINQAWFGWTATKFAHVLYPEVWFAAAIPWTEHNSEAFAGTHEKHVLVVFDEASAIADKIWEVTEGAMTTPGAMWLAFGNPTQTTGRFSQCFGKFKHRWTTRQIDSRTAKMANKAQIQKWIDDYGEDHDFVRVRVRGVFPRAGSLQFISLDTVAKAQRRKSEGLEPLTDAPVKRPGLFKLDDQLSDDTEAELVPDGKGGLRRPTKLEHKLAQMTKATQRYEDDEDSGHRAGKQSAYDVMKDLGFQPAKAE